MIQVQRCPRLCNLAMYERFFHKLPAFANDLNLFWSFLIGLTETASGLPKIIAIALFSRKKKENVLMD